MIRPYLAVIADSFHAALASRVLWVALFAIWLLLAGLAPVGYREDYTTTFRPRDFRNGTGMKATLAAALVVPEQRDTPAGRIAAALPEDLKRQLRRVGNDEEIRIRLSLFAEAMNELLEDEVWYSEEAWGRTMRYGELRRLEETPAGELSESLKRRRARLRIEAALPGAFRARSPRSITLTYAGFDFPADFAVDKTRFVDLVNQFVIPTMISWLLGFALVFLGILVTAPVVPDMLQPGSLHLLLSKPISRAALLLSKFLGGCAFVLLCVTQLVVGLWLIAGFRLDLWNPRLLWCIPVSVFLFSVFYSVSVVAALRWRSPILAVGVTCLFGALCLVVGLIGGLFDQFVTRPERIRSVTAAEDTFVGATFGGGLVRWDPASNRWIEVIESSATSGDRVFPPVRLGPRQVVTADAPRGRFNVYASGGLDLLVLDGASGWEPQPAIRLPTATTRLHRFGEQHLLAVNTSGIMITDRRTVLEQVTTSAAKPGREDDSERSTSSRADGASAAGTRERNPLGGWLSNLVGRRGGSTDRFSPVLPEAVSLVSPVQVVVDPDDDAIVLLSRGRLLRLRPPDSGPTGTWRVAADEGIGGEPSKAGELAVSDSIVLVAREDEPLRFFRAGTLEPVAEADLLPRLIPVQAVGLPGDRFVVVTSDGRARVIATSAASTAEPRVQRELPISDIESVSADWRGGRLMIAHHTDRLDTMDLHTLEPRGRIRPSTEGWRFVNRYVVSPLRTVVPQTGELGETVASLISGKSAVAINRDAADGGELIRYQITRPVASCAGFIAVMLTLACVSFARRDF